MLENYHFFLSSLLCVFLDYSPHPAIAALFFFFFLFFFLYRL